MHGDSGSSLASGIHISYVYYLGGRLVNCYDMVCVVTGWNEEYGHNRDYTMAV